MTWPSEIQSLILETFGSHAQKAYGQLATVSTENHPSVRTVHIHAVTHPETGLVVSCNTKSEKWSSIQKNPWVAGCFWNMANQTQFRFEGKAQLLDEKNTNQTDLLQEMWMKMRKEVRITYLLDERNADLDTDEVEVEPDHRSKNHGVIFIRPERWDIFENNPHEYRLGKRWIYTVEKNSWKKREVTSLHEQI